MTCNERQTIKLFENFTDSGIDKICNIVTQKLKCDEIEYDIQFFSCLYQLTKERQKIVRKHKSTCTTQKRSLADKSKENYANLEPAKKTIRSEKTALNFKNMDPEKTRSS